MNFLGPLFLGSIVNLSINLHKMFVSCVSYSMLVIHKALLVDILFVEYLLCIYSCLVYMVMCVIFLVKSNCYGLFIKTFFLYIIYYVGIVF